MGVGRAWWLTVLHDFDFGGLLCSHSVEWLAIEYLHLEAQPPPPPQSLHTSLLGSTIRGPCYHIVHVNF